MRLWTAGSAPERPAHVTAWARFPRWSNVAIAAAVPALALIAYASPLLHGSVRHDTAAASPLLAAQAPHHDDLTALAAAPVTGSTVPPASVPSTTSAAPARPTPGWPAEELAAVSPLAADGIPQTALAAYRAAALRADRLYPNCELPWPLLAAIGRVESDHGRYGGAVLYANGTSSRKILGIPLDGTRSALIRDTDHGRLDGDRTYDRAVGPMQFIPSTWKSYAADGNRDGRKDPFNIFDATAAAADYLCVAGGDLGTEHGQIRAVLAYNHSSAYLAEVLALEKTYATGVGIIVPVGPRAPKPPRTTPRQPPPVDPGPPLAHKPHRGKASGSGSPTAPASSSASSSHPPSTSPHPSSSAPSSEDPSSCTTTSPSQSASTGTPSDGSSSTDVPSDSASSSTDAPSGSDTSSGSPSGSDTSSGSPSGSNTSSGSASGSPSC